MMLFYLCNIPVNSILDIDTVVDIVMERYKSYTGKSRNYYTSHEHDVVGHFFVCLIAIKSTLLNDVILKGECSLFIDRLSKVNIDKVRKQISSCEKFLDTIDQIELDSFRESTLLKSKTLIQNVLKTFQYTADHVFSVGHEKECQKYKMILPFSFVLNLVASRSIDITKGKAEVFCGQWWSILKEIFVHFLKFEIRFLREFKLLQDAVFGMEDDRLRRIIDKCMTNITGRSIVNYEKVTAGKVDEVSQYFPPCMANLHKILRQRHRLSYDSRYQYMLFLKDIGMPVDENVKFWKSEYTKPYESSSCTHYWHEKISRYEYQIHHLYGMSGSKIQKSSHPCQKFTGNMTLRMDGGCPFVHLGNDDLYKAFPSHLVETDIEDILSFKAGKKPQRACAIFAQSQKDHFGRKAEGSLNQLPLTEILSPLHFYHLMRGMDS